MTLEKNRQILFSKLVLVMKLIAGVSIALDAGIWIFQYYAYIVENLKLGIIAALITFTLIHHYKHLRKSQYI